MQNMKTVTAKANQTVFDMALEQYGTAEAVSEIAGNNPELKNDPDALVALGIDPLYDSGFYFDVAITPGAAVKIDTNSKLIRSNTVRELTNEITTFDL